MEITASMVLAIRLLAAICALFAWGLLLSACGRLPPPEQSGELVVGIREAPGFYQREDGDESGFEHDLVRAFATKLGLKLRLVIAKDTLELAALAKQNQIHMAVAMPMGNADLEWSQPIRKIAHVIVGLADELGPSTVEDLPEHSVHVLAGAPLGDVLRALPTPPQIIEVPGLNEMELLEGLASDRNTLAAVPEIHLDLASNYFPDLRAVIRLPDELSFAWAFGGPQAADLREKADAFIADATRDGTLARLHDRYFGHTKRIDALSATKFIDDIRTRLTTFRPHFKLAEELTGIDWRLIAALAYQESKWDPVATSYTNVRGMMMLTEDTADRLGVKNRLDPAESIHAGSRYLADLIEQLPDNTPYPDRLWLGLAGYNLGMGHLRGGIAVAKGMKRDPASWYEMKQVLPLLSRPAVYARLKSGRARGGEAVIMVENIRTYFDILARFEAPHTTPYPRSTKTTKNFMPG
jgi:membrane-bound lytic murein transglycosylase F